MPEAVLKSTTPRYLRLVTVDGRRVGKRPRKSSRPKPYAVPPHFLAQQSAEAAQGAEYLHEILGRLRTAASAGDRVTVMALAQAACLEAGGLRLLTASLAKDLEPGAGAARGA